MLSDILKKPVELSVDNKVIKFSSLEEFEFALSPRTAVPYERVSKMMLLPVNELSDELQAIDVAKDEVSRLMSHSPETSIEVSARLEATPSVSFSKEHNWREIFVGLKNSDCSRTHPYKNTALKMYLRYLTNRMDIIRHIKNDITNKESMDDSDNRSVLSETAMPDYSRLSTLESEADLLSTDITMKSMLKGEAVVIEIQEGDAMIIRLARYNCKLLARDGMKFIDFDGVEHSLELGKNNIGRDEKCAVTLNDETRQISRVHLSIYNYDHKKLLLTDLSTQGTSIPKKDL